MTPAATPDSPVPMADRFGNDGMRHVVYVSKATPGNDPSVLNEILRTARRNNHVAGITGLLVYFDGRFLQYLEGPALAVHGTLAQIKEDTRHHDMHVLLDDRTRERLFRTWDMGCIDVGTENWLRLVEADWPSIPKLSRHSVSGLAVLQELAGYPAETPDRPKVFGSNTATRAPDNGSARLEIREVPDVPPELRRARLQLGAALAVGIVLALMLLYAWLH